MKNNIIQIDAEWAKSVLRKRQEDEINEHMEICNDLIVEAVEKGWNSARVEKIAINDFVIANLKERGFSIKILPQNFGDPRVTFISWKP